MKKIVKIVSIVFVIIAGVAGISYRFVNNIEDVKRNDYKISFNKINSEIYVSARAWGISGNHTEIVLSNSPIIKEYRAYSKDECYIFYTYEIYYKQEKDTLFIYANKSSISEPVKFESRINIIIENLNTFDELRDYENNYKKYGLKKITSIIN